MKRIFCLLLLAPLLAFGQFVVIKPGQKPVPIVPSYAMPPGKIFTNTKTIPSGRVGYGIERLEVACVRSGGVPNTGTCSTDPFDSDDLNPGQTDGAFRITCTFSHASFEDPIVWPGQPGMTHGHAFYGNSKTDSFTLDMGAQGNSSCTGGILNRTGYWVPWWVYDRPGNLRHGEVLVGYTLVAYYKTFTTSTPVTTTHIRWPSPNHRMIAGDPNSTGPQSNVRYDCANVSTGLTHAFDHIPTTAEATALGAGNCDEIIAIVEFPQCWDGLSLGGVLGKGHMAFKNGTANCSDPNFPIEFPWISVNVHYKVALADLNYWRLSSDKPGLPAGHSGHSDWWNGWKMTPASGITEAVTDMILRNCDWAKADCHANILGPTVAQPNNVYRLR